MTVGKIREETNRIIKNQINPKENGKGVIKGTENRWEKQ